MEDIRIKLVELEGKIKLLLKGLNTLQSENDILIKENIRLKEENNQFVGEMKSDLEYSKRSDLIGVTSELNINIDYVKRELNDCIAEVERCIAESK